MLRSVGYRGSKDLRNAPAKGDILAVTALDGEETKRSFKLMAAEDDDLTAIDDRLASVLRPFPVRCLNEKDSFPTKGPRT